MISFRANYLIASGLSMMLLFGCKLITETHEYHIEGTGLTWITSEIGHQRFAIVDQTQGRPTDNHCQKLARSLVKVAPRLDRHVEDVLNGGVMDVASEAKKRGFVCTDALCKVSLETWTRETNAPGDPLNNKKIFGNIDVCFMRGNRPIKVLASASSRS